MDAYVTLAIMSLIGLIYMRLRGDIKLFPHEYVTYSYPNKYITIVNMNDKRNTRHHWDSRDDSCMTTANSGSLEN